MKWVPWESSDTEQAERWHSACPQRAPCLMWEALPASPHTDQTWSPHHDCRRSHSKAFNATVTHRGRDGSPTIRRSVNGSELTVRLLPPRQLEDRPLPRLLTETGAPPGVARAVCRRRPWTPASACLPAFLCSQFSLSRCFLQLTEEVGNGSASRPPAAASGNIWEGAWVGQSLSVLRTGRSASIPTPRSFSQNA